MNKINFNGLPKKITVQELIELEKNLKKLPKGFKIQKKKKKKTMQKN